MDMNIDPHLSTRLSELLTRNSLTLAVAESCTGGLLGAYITSAPGASAYFRGGVIAYDNEIKRDILGVPPELLETHGAVSAQAVESMAIGAARLFGSDCAVSVSGIAGPGGGSVEKPVGLVFFGVSIRGETDWRSFRFTGDRDAVREASVLAAVGFLIEAVT